MRGHEGILRLRRAGLVPSFVCINDFPCKTDWEEFSDAVATICVHGANLSDIDFRCLVGIPVTIAAESERRANGLFTLAKDSGASRVIAAHANGQGDGWVGVWTKEKGVIYG